MDGLNEKLRVVLWAPFLEWNLCFLCGCYHLEIWGLKKSWVQHKTKPKTLFYIIRDCSENVLQDYVGLERVHRDFGRSWSCPGWTRDLEHGGASSGREAVYPRQHLR